MKQFILDKYKQHQDQVHRFCRFLITGVWNTVFGIGVYSLLLWLFEDKVNYLILMIPSNILAITNAYICYKIFVFKTKRNILREYIRFYMVYGVSTLLSFLLMFGLVSGLGIPAIYSQFPCLVIITLCSYISHHKFSFKPGNPDINA